MYEGRFKAKSVGEPGKSPDLRQFRWTDLVAKLAASRDLRDELHKVDGGFNAFAEARRESCQESKPTVNQAALSDGKAAGLGLGDAAGNAVQGDREKE
ncbi:hypothetical protein [Qipengyuania sp.]|uniref:hypothetical protein n=1 Tax=Qipengyuania sp. TaxID=2004515 RepID=UPI0035194BAF